MVDDFPRQLVLFKIALQLDQEAFAEIVGEHARRFDFLLEKRDEFMDFFSRKSRDERKFSVCCGKIARLRIGPVQNGLRQLLEIVVASCEFNDGRREIVIRVLRLGQGGEEIFAGLFRGALIFGFVRRGEIHVERCVGKRIVTSEFRETFVFFSHFRGFVLVVFR